MSMKPLDPELQSMPEAAMLLKALGPRVTIEPSATPSKNFACGLRALTGLRGAERLAEGEKSRLTWRCYDAPAGATLKLVIAFSRDDKPEKPKGVLELLTTRGKLSATRMELKGDRDRVEVDFKAPDETIKISIRVRIAGYRRGKIHLHLE